VQRTSKTIKQASTATVCRFLSQVGHLPHPPCSCFNSTTQNFNRPQSSSLLFLSFTYISISNQVIISYTVDKRYCCRSGITTSHSSRIAFTLSGQDISQRQSTLAGAACLFFLLSPTYNFSQSDPQSGVIDSQAHIYQPKTQRHHTKHKACFKTVPPPRNEFDPAPLGEGSSRTWRPHRALTPSQS
jgi:hypothetical protein